MKTVEHSKYSVGSWILGCSMQKGTGLSWTSRRATWLVEMDESRCVRKNCIFARQFWCTGRRVDIGRRAQTVEKYSKYSTQY